MLYEYALISVVVASGYWGVHFLRHPPNGTPLFGLMQLAAALAAGLGLLSDDHPAFGVLGAIGLGAGTCMLVVGPALRAIARRLAAADRITAASRLLDVADVLAPGSGVAEEKALLGAMSDIRAGRVEHTVDALTAAKSSAPPEAQVAIDERIAMLYLAAYRWRDAIAHAEATLGDAITAAEPAPPPPGDRPLSLRDALGIAPPVWVELLGAYARTGDLDRAARMIARLEDVCRDREDAALWLHRARMMFLALAGRPAAVRTLIEPRRARHMSRAARTYWLAVALEHHGERDAASAAYHRARGRSRGRPRELIDEALARLAQTSGDLGGIGLSPVATEVVERIEAAPLPPPIRVVRSRVPWATWGLTAAVLGVAAVIAAAVGPSSDLGVLLRAGAMVRGRIDAGEWWRLVSCVFVHVGTLHLAVNALGLFFIARVAEEMFGTARTIAIYAVAGVAGAVASYLASPVGISAGASGAIFGLLGAVFIELTLHRERYRAAWKRGLWGGIVVITLAQVAVGFMYPAIDQWAHGAGLIGGVVAGAALSPTVRWAALTRHLARAIALGFAVVAAIAAVEVIETSITSILDEPTARFELGDVAVTAPSSWLVRGDLIDPDNLIIVSAARTTAGDPETQVADWVRAADAAARDRGLVGVTKAPARVVALPDGWDGAELVSTLDDALGNTHTYRVIAAGRRFGDVLVLVHVFVPETVATAAPAFFGRLIGSIQLR